MDRSSFSRIAVAAVTITFLVAIFIYRQIQVSQKFEMVGVVEGFYGNPWTHTERLDMIIFMGEVGMNTYFYAPKDDPFHRANWRELYSGEHLERFQELVRVAEDANINLYYAISPGLNIEYSNPDDYTALKEKLFSMHILGVKYFALFLDDVPETLQHESDKQAYSNLASAHVDLINRLIVDLDSIQAGLIVCPTTYTDAWGDREYVRILGEGIPKNIPLFWTGTDVAIEKITDAEARFWGQKMSRKPLIWDNFPVNDFEVWRPIIGPITGREAGLAKSTTGIIANPMDKPYLSMIPLHTVAAYGRSPFNYDEKRAWQNALTSLAGVEASRVLRPLALLFADYGWTENVFTPIYTPGKQLSINDVRDAINLMDEVILELEAPDFAENDYIQKILPELKPFALSIRADFEGMLADRFYRIDAEGFLVFQSELEEIIVPHTPVNIDGNLSEWSNAEFKSLNSANPQDQNRVQAAFRTLNQKLSIAIKVQTNRFQVHTAQSWSGDQVLIALDLTPNRPGTWIEPTDMLVKLRPPDKYNQVDMTTSSMYLTAFSQRGISDISMRTISSFFSNFVKEPHKSLIDFSEQILAEGRRTADGYELEVQFPVNAMNEINLTLSVNDATIINGTPYNTNFMLANRPYIGNPNTYVTLILN
jgi:hypothetical protein